MSGRDVYPDDMGLLFDTAELDRVLAGQALPDDAPIARFVDDLRETFPASSIPHEVEAAHLTAILAATSEDPVPEAAAAPSRLERVRSSLAARVGALTLAAGSGLTGAAYAGVLPDRVQRVVSDTAARVGVDLPHPDQVAAGSDANQGSDGRAHNAPGEGRGRQPGADPAGPEGSTLQEADDRSGRDGRPAGGSGTRDDASSGDDRDDSQRDEQETEDSDTSGGDGDDSSDSDAEDPAAPDDEETDEADRAGDETDPSDTEVDIDDGDDVDDGDDSDAEDVDDSASERESADDVDLDSEDLENDLED